MLGPAVTRTSSCGAEKKGLFIDAVIDNIVYAQRKVNCFDPDPAARCPAVHYGCRQYLERSAGSGGATRRSDKGSLSDRPVVPATVPARRPAFALTPPVIHALIR